MKNIYFILIIAGLFLTSISQESQNNTAILTVNIDGFENNKGKVRIAVGDSEEDFSSQGNNAYKFADTEIKDKRASHTFSDLPYGFYAVKVFHDENHNDEMDSNFMGIPSELYGFSNNARGTFGPASWDDAKFEIKNDSLLISITVE